MAGERRDDRLLVPRRRRGLDAAARRSRAFSKEGPAPVYVGFGSMAFLDREATLAAVIGRA